MFHDPSYLLFLLDVHFNIYVRIRNKQHFSKIFAYLNLFVLGLKTQVYIVSTYLLLKMLLNSKVKCVGKIVKS